MRSPSLAALLVTLLASSAAGNTATWPDWVKPGVRVTYYSASATVPGSPASLVPGEGGSKTWVNQQTGQKYTLRENAGGSAEAYNQHTVYAVTPDRIVFSSEALLLTRGMPTGVTTTASGASFATPTQGVEIWMPPAALRQMPERLPDPRRGQVGVSRLEYRLGDRVYDAVRVSELSADASTRAFRTYDLDTGLLLHVAMATRMRPRMTAPGADGRPGQGMGDVMLIDQQLVNLRQTSLPGIGQAAPPHLADRTAATLRMSQSLRMPEAPAMPPQVQQVRASLAFDGPMMTVTINGQQQRSVTGGAYIDPRELAQLRPGQVLDDDPVTGVRTRVVATEPGLVGIQRVNPLETETSIYDARTGVGLRVHVAKNVGGTAVQHRTIEVTYE